VCVASHALYLYIHYTLVLGPRRRAQTPGEVAERAEAFAAGEFYMSSTVVLFRVVA